MINRSLDIDLHSSKNYYSQGTHAGTRTIQRTHLQSPPTPAPTTHDSPSYAIHRTQYPSSICGTENPHRRLVSIPQEVQSALTTEQQGAFPRSTQRSVVIARAVMAGNVAELSRVSSENFEGLSEDARGSSVDVAEAYCYPASPFYLSTSRQRRGVPAIPSLVAPLRRAPGDGLAASPVMSEVTNENEKRSS